ncbi:MAG: hypothetical protein D8M59_14055 [Planctomycetes bacterium]|nr:hypothetical protein [Planctomycetota bacterium]NOG55632.1 hypothetical protein [Planctomycetota bacterium]
MADLAGGLISQYHASLAMLKQAIDQCPANDMDHDLWYVGHMTSGHRVPFWHLAYHTLFYTHLYLMPHLDDFVAWEHHQDEAEHFDRMPPDGRDPKPCRPYTKEEILSYWQCVSDLVDSAVGALDLDAETCGFFWYDPMPKLDHQINNIRHIQHHTAQLADRLWGAVNQQVDWRGKAKREGLS